MPKIIVNFTLIADTVMFKYRCFSRSLQNWHIWPCADRRWPLSHDLNKRESVH